MIRKHLHHNHPFVGDAPVGSACLEADGHYLARGLFSTETVERLRAETEEVYHEHTPDWRPGSPSLEHAQMFRYEMFNRSAVCQEIIGRREILDIVEPLLGDDCHVISCTAWRNPAGTSSAPRGLQWHVDGGPYIARPEGQDWPEHIAYPIFVVTTHIYLEEVTLEDGPTAMLPGSHKSGRLPPSDRMWDLDLRYGGRGAEVHVAEPGDVTFFVSEVWHRRMPPGDGCRGRFFLQTGYGRREVAQRVRLTEHLSPVSDAAAARAVTERQRRLLGLHPPGFYDS